MSHAVAVQLPLRKSNFCGESEPDNHGAPLEQSRELRRECAGRASRRDLNKAQPHENLGPILGSFASSGRCDWRRRPLHHHPAELG
jgi:hypothetical protein